MGKMINLFNRKNKVKYSGINIDVKKNILFVHIPKNGGSSLAASLNFEKSSHIKSNQIIRKIGLKKFHSFNSFSIVRHPISRFWSLYNYARMEVSDYHNNIDPSKAIYGVHKDYQLLKDASIEDCVEFLLKGELRHDAGWNHWEPQCTWTHDGPNCLVNKILKLENLENGILELNTEFNLDLEVKHLNKSDTKSDYNSWGISDAILDKLKGFYANDFQYFGYDFT